MAKEAFELTAELRNDQGRGASRRLRRSGKVPAVLYGGTEAARALSLQHHQLIHQLENEAFYSSILTIKVGDVEQQAILKDLQRHPAKPIVMHADFQRIFAGEKITLSVPLHFNNEDTAPGVRAGGIVSHVQNEVEISCLPKNLPEYLEVDLADLELDGMLHLSDIKVPEGVEILDLAVGRENDQPVVAIHRPMKEEEEEQPEVEGEEGAAEDGAEKPEASKDED